MSRHGIGSAPRYARGVLFGASSAVLTIGAHALAGGGLPDAATTLLLTTLIGWTASALAAKAGGTLGTLTILGAGQLITHLLLDTMTTHVGSHASATGITGVADGLAMVLTHTGATIVTALLLARAESMLRAVGDAMHALLPMVRRPPPVPTAGARLILNPLAETRQLVSVIWRRINGRRGPPIYS